MYVKEYWGIDKLLIKCRPKIYFQHGAKKAFLKARIYGLSKLTLCSQFLQKSPQNMYSIATFQKLAFMIHETNRNIFLKLVFILGLELFSRKIALFSTFVQCCK